jgi:hypothetical protein
MLLNLNKIGEKNIIIKNTTFIKRGVLFEQSFFDNQWDN